MSTKKNSVFKLNLGIRCPVVKKHRVFCLKLCKKYKKLKKSKNLQIIMYKLCKLCDNMK